MATSRRQAGIDAAIRRGEERGWSVARTLREYRRRSRAAGGRGVRTQAFYHRAQDVRLADEGVDLARLPGRATVSPRRQAMRVTRDPRGSRFFYWMMLDIEEPDGSVRSDQHYSFDHKRDLTDRAAVSIAIQKWNRMMRTAPQTGSMTGTAVGGRVLAVAPIVKGSGVA